MEAEKALKITDIQSMHDRLENMKATQSVKIVNELKSDAHRHRGLLLAEVERLTFLLAEERKKVAMLEAETCEIWDEGLNGSNSESVN